VVFVHLPVKVLKKESALRVSSYYGLIERDTPYPSHLFDNKAVLFDNKAVYWLLGQGAIGLAQPFSVYTNTIVRLLLDYTVDPINSGFKVVILAF
jgi:hypothetical protein